jgi:alcohol dehydrogenase
MHNPDIVWEFAIVDRIAFGNGSVEELGDRLADRVVSTLLVVTDEGLLESGVVDAVRESIPEGVEVSVIGGVGPYPNLDVCGGGA